MLASVSVRLPAFADFSISMALEMALVPRALRIDLVGIRVGSLCCTLTRGLRNREAPMRSENDCDKQPAGHFMNSGRP
jgi:hypothetical protein